MRFHRAVRFLALALVLLAIPAALSSPSSAQIAIGISVHIGPPALPVYDQPICPGAGYLWTPGYWAWDDDGGYYWVPGTWVVAPVGMLWTPGYWGWNNGLYAWNAGYVGQCPFEGLHFPLAIGDRSGQIGVRYGLHGRAAQWFQSHGFGHALAGNASGAMTRLTFGLVGVDTTLRHSQRRQGECNYQAEQSDSLQ